MNLDHELSFALDLARSAGAMALRYHEEFHYRTHSFREDHNNWVRWKSKGDPVTIADQAINDFCVAKIRQVFPKDALLTEEMPDDGSRHQLERTWVIDPIDGTREFIAGRVGFSVMIGLLINGNPMLGVVYQPRVNHLYLGRFGQGAYCLDGNRKEQLHTSQRKDLAKLHLVRSVSPRSPWMKKWMERLGIYHEFRIGSLGVKLCLIAAGNQDVYINTGGKAKLWDTCAPEVILREAGGILTDLRGKNLDYTGSSLQHRKGILASNGAIHSNLLTSLQHR